MDKETEQEIVKGLQKGCRDAWLQLYEVYAESVWRNVARLIGSDSVTVADIVQETFLAAARSVRSFDPRRGSLWIWLWTIARRQVALHYRKQKPNIALDRARQWWASLDGTKFDWMDAKADTPVDIIQSQELAVLVRRTLSELPPDYQILLVTKYVDNLSAEHIAGQMKCSNVAVRSKLARARKAFRKAFRKIVRIAPDSWEVSQ
jgi:RNA polymerase sigma-70 factor (ECF subfamily)